MTRQGVLPWRLPFIPINSVDTEGSVYFITPVLDWIGLIDPGDCVELCDLVTFDVTLICGVCWLRKSLAWTLTTEELGGVALNDYLTFLQNIYGIEINAHTPLLCICMLPISSGERSYTCVLNTELAMESFGELSSLEG